MFNPTRDEVRRFFCDAWKKHHEKELLTPLESMALDIMQLHPEYHPVLDNPELAENREENPFLHLSLHLAVMEQLSIDQPFGIKSRFDAILRKSESRHHAFHLVMECLGEMIWQAQRQNAQLDSGVYFECLEKRT